MTPQNVRGAPWLVAVGEPLIQLTPLAGQRLVEARDLRLHLGGAEVNVVVTLARLGLPVSLLTRLGDDPFGRRIIQELRFLGVGIEAIAFDVRSPTGVYFKDFDGQRSTSHYYRAGSAAASLDIEDLNRLPLEAPWVHVTGVTSALSSTCSAVVDELLDQGIRTGAAVSFDVNFRPALWTDRDASDVLLRQARRAELVFVGRDEAHALWGTDTPDDVRSLMPDVPTLVVKDAARSAVSFCGARREDVPALAVEVVEPVGAGDAFAAGYLAARFEGRDERIALRWGHLLGARATMSHADQGEVPAPGELEQAALLSEHAWERREFK